MTNIETLCSCGKRYPVPSDFAGRVVNCPSCNAALTIPITEAVPLVEVNPGLTVTIAPSDHPATLIPRKQSVFAPFLAGFLVCLVVGTLAYLAHSPNPLTGSTSNSVKPSTVSSVPPLSEPPNDRRSGPSDIRAVTDTPKEARLEKPPTSDSAPVEPPKARAKPVNLAGILPEITLAPAMPHRIGLIRDIRMNTHGQDWVFSPGGTRGFSQVFTKDKGLIPGVNRIQAWDLVTGRTGWSYVGLGGESRDNGGGCLTISPNGRYLVAKARFPRPDSVRAGDVTPYPMMAVWNASNGKIESHYTPENWLSYVARVTFFPDSTNFIVLAKGATDFLYVQNVKCNIIIKNNGLRVGDIGIIATSGDGKHILTGGRDSSIGVSDDNYRGIGSYDEHSVTSQKVNKTLTYIRTSYVDFIRSSPDGRHVVSRGDGEFHIWNLQARQRVATVEPLLLGPWWLSDDWRKWVSTDAEGAIHVWSTEEGREIFSAKPEIPGAARQIFITLDGHFAITVSDDHLSVWGLPKGSASSPDNAPGEESTEVRTPERISGEDTGDLSGVPHVKNDEPSKSAPKGYDEGNELDGVTRAEARPSEKSKPSRKEMGSAKTASPFAQIKDEGVRKTLEYAALNAKRVDSSAAAERFLKQAEKAAHGDSEVLEEIKKLRGQIAELRKNAR